MVRIQSECRKIRSRKTPNTDTFHAVKDMQRFEKVQHKTLQVVYNNYMATYNDCLALEKKLNIHHWLLQF